MNRSERRWAIGLAVYFAMSVLTFGYAANRVDCTLTQYPDGSIASELCKERAVARAALGAIFWPYYISSEIFNRV